MAKSHSRLGLVRCVVLFVIATVDIVACRRHWCCGGWKWLPSLLLRLGMVAIAIDTDVID